MASLQWSQGRTHPFNKLVTVGGRGARGGEKENGERRKTKIVISYGHNYFVFLKDITACDRLR